MLDLSYEHKVKRYNSFARPQQDQESQQGKFLAHWGKKKGTVDPENSKFNIMSPDCLVSYWEKTNGALQHKELSMQLRLYKTSIWGLNLFFIMIQAFIVYSRFPNLCHKSMIEKCIHSQTSLLPRWDNLQMHDFRQIVVTLMTVRQKLWWLLIMPIQLNRLVSKRDLECR